jgi:hypothetical protein
MALELKLRSSEEFAALLREHAEKIRYCNEHGHTSTGGILSSTSTYDYCGHCGVMYTRRRTAAENQRWRELMNTPMGPGYR